MFGRLLWAICRNEEESEGKDPRLNFRERPFISFLILTKSKDTQWLITPVQLRSPGLSKLALRPQIQIWNTRVWSSYWRLVKPKYGTQEFISGHEASSHLLASPDLDLASQCEFRKHGRKCLETPADSEDATQIFQVFEDDANSFQLCSFRWSLSSGSSEPSEDLHRNSTREPSTYFYPLISSKMFNTEVVMWCS